MFEILRIQEGRVRFVGRFDASQADDALKELGKTPGPLTIDLGDLDYISSAGLGVIMATHRRLSDAGQSLCLTNMQPRVRNLFKYSGLDQVLQIEERPE
jgi:anti-sigma B factor antagonist